MGIGPEFASCWLKLRRAETHLDSLKAELKKWTDSKPYKTRRELNSDGSHHAVILDVVGSLPFDELSLVAGDCVHNLRSCLDHLIYAFAIQKSGKNPPPRFRNIEFPICETPEGFDKKRNLIASSVRAKAEVFIEKSQPYQRVHPDFPPLLGMLGEFDNSDKHRMLNLAFSEVSDAKIEFIPTLGTPTQVHFRKGPINNGDTVCFFDLNPPNRDVCYNLHLSIAVTIGHLPSPSGRNVSAIEDVLGVLMSEVKRLLNEVVGI